MTHKTLEKQAAQFFKSYAIACDGIAYRSGSTVFREVYISFERRKVKFAYGAPLSQDTTREWGYETPDDLMRLLPKDEQGFDKKLWENA